MLCPVDAPLNISIICFSTRGEVVEDFIVYPEYVSFIEAIQHKMRECIERRQFVIECCPSSNVKIGRLKRFDQHPIFTFCSVKNGNNHNLPVTVNTDDLGIFYTSLPREFELLTLALLKKKNEDGSTLYSSQEVYDWIERIVRKALPLTTLRYSGLRLVIFKITPSATQM